MHMADALISPAVGGVMWAASAGLAVHAARKIESTPDRRDIPLMGVMGAFVFAAQMLNFAIPGTGSSGHLGGGLLLAILLGPYRGFLTMASVLLIQSLFFADGGLLAYGCNLFNLGFFTCFIAYPLAYLPLAKRRGGTSAASLVAAIVGLQLGAFAVVLETLWSGTTSLSFSAFVLAIQPIHLVIGVVEGLATAAVVAAVAKSRPDLVEAPADRDATARPLFKLCAVLALAAMVTGGVLSWFASPSPDGLEWALERAGAGETEVAPTSGVHAALANLQTRTAILPDYGFAADGDGNADAPAAPSIPAESVPEPSEPWPAVNAGVTVSGLAGGLLSMALALVLGVAASRIRRPAKRRGES